MKKVSLLLAALLAYAGAAFAVVNINSASQKQLEELPGVGPAKAKAIIDYRKKNGPFRTTQDVKKVDGIGDATYNQIKGDLVTSGTTTGVGKPAGEEVRVVEEGREEVNSALSRATEPRRARCSRALNEGRDALQTTLEHFRRQHAAGAPAAHPGPQPATSCSRSSRATTRRAG